MTDEQLMQRVIDTARQYTDHKSSHSCDWDNCHIALSLALKALDAFNRMRSADYAKEMSAKPNDQILQDS